MKSNIKKFVYEMPQELSNNLRLRILRNGWCQSLVPSLSFGKKSFGTSG